jgi:predicted anti-sigma-YlaC factor YlaD
VNCSEIQDLAAALIDHEPLGEREQGQVEYHLQTCPFCRYEYDMDRITSRIVRARMPVVRAPQEAYRRVLQAIED